MDYDPINRPSHYCEGRKYSRCHTVASESEERERVVIGEFGPGEREIVFPESFLGGPESVQRIREALSSYGMVSVFIVSPQLAERHRD